MVPTFLATLFGQRPLYGHVSGRLSQYISCCLLMRHRPLRHRVQIQWGVLQSLDLWVHRQNQHRRHCCGSSLVSPFLASLELRYLPQSRSVEVGLWRTVWSCELTRAFMSQMRAPLVRSVRWRRLLCHSSWHWQIIPS